MVEVAAALGVPAWELAAGAGEDYELCVSLSPVDAAHIDDLTVVGRVLEGEPGLSLSDSAGPRVLTGHQHALG